MSIVHCVPALALSENSECIGSTTRKWLRISSVLNLGSGEPLDALFRLNLGMPVPRPSVSSSSLKNSPIRRFRVG